MNNVFCLEGAFFENERSKQNFPFSHRTSCVHVGGRERVCLFFLKQEALTLEYKEACGERARAQEVA